MGEDRSRRRWASIFGRAPGAEVDEELSYHVERRVRDYIARGMHPDAARAASLERLGDLEHVRRECTDMLTSERRTEARRTWLKLSWLDFKLGFRMLVRYPGLTLVGGLAMAFAIWVGAGTFEFVTQLVDPTLPLPDGDRVVGIRNWDATSAGIDEPTLYDFVSWRAELDAVEDLGAFRTSERNLIIGEGAGSPVEVAEMSAAGFEVARVPPLLGRHLVESDEREGAPAVAVIGHDLWRTRFDGDPDVVGRTVRLGGTPTTVVGVMPQGFAFPVNHRLWVPLRLNVLDYERGDGPEVRVFGRLAPGATLSEAQAELATLGARAAADFPDTHEHLKPEVVGYAESIFPIRVGAALRAGIYSSNLIGVMLLVLMCGNVALLMFARAATRENELVVRNALGASRGRIITQLFTEALVLGGVAAIVGLAAAGAGLDWAYRVVEDEMLEGNRLPFWFESGLSPMTAVYAGVLAVLGAVVAGVIPALKVTGKNVEARLRQAGAGGGGFRFGGLWTAVIVAQVAVTVALPAMALFLRRDAVQIRTADVGFAEEEYLSVRIEMDRGVMACEVVFCNPVIDDSSRAGLRATSLELERRLLAEPGVLDVTFAQRFPRMYHPFRLVEVDEGGAAPIDPRWPGYRVSSVAIAPDFFEVLGAPILAGRGFHAADLDSDHGVVVVNQSFVELVLGGRNPIGRRVRYIFADEADELYSPEEPGPWHEIIGVVPDLGMKVGAEQDRDPRSDPKVAGFYHPVSPGATSPLHMAVHVRGDPAAFAPIVRGHATAVDPTLRLYELRPLEELSASTLEFIRFWFWLIIGVSAIALALSLAGIYAVMAFTVAQRAREIGIRVALGADARRVTIAIFRRPLAQVGLGIVLGGAFVALMADGVLGALSAKEVGLVLAYAALMMAVCMLACIMPTRRALAVEPTEALRADA